MTEVSGWVFTICSGALICGVVSALVPGKTYESSIKLLLGIFMLFCFLSPFSAALELPKVDTEQAEERRLEIAEGVKSQLDEQLRHNSSEALTKSAVGVLSPYAIKESETEIILMTDNDDKVYAKVVLPKRCSNNHDTIHRLLQYEFGIPVLMEYSGKD